MIAICHVDDSGDSAGVGSEPAVGCRRHAALRPASHRHLLWLPALHEVHHLGQA